MAGMCIPSHVIFSLAAAALMAPGTELRAGAVYRGESNQIKVNQTFEKHPCRSQSRPFASAHEKRFYGETVQANRG